MNLVSYAMLKKGSPSPSKILESKPNLLCTLGNRVYSNFHIHQLLDIFPIGNNGGGIGFPLFVLWGSSLESIFPRSSWRDQLEELEKVAEEALLVRSWELLHWWSGKSRKKNGIFLGRKCYWLMVQKSGKITSWYGKISQWFCSAFKIVVHFHRWSRTSSINLLGWFFRYLDVDVHAW